jgi:hypothetical protein
MKDGNWDAAMLEEIRELRVRLNESLRCETMECEDLRAGMDERCAGCKATEDEMRGLYASEHHYTIDELRDCYSHPTDRHKLMSLEREN